MSEPQTAVSQHLPASTRRTQSLRARMIDTVRSLVREGVVLRGPGAGLRFGTEGISLGYFLGTVDRTEQDALAARLKPGDVFYDVGANVGVYTALGARLVGPAGTVVAFEPFAASSDATRRNCARNGLTNVTVVQAAVAEQSGEVALRVGDASVINRIAGAESVGEGEALIVPMVSIDEYIRQSGAPLPSVVMVDVEQAELRVLEGMLETIKRARPVLFVEVHWLGTDFTKFIRERILPLGYRAATLAGDALPDDIVRYHALLTPEAGAAR